MSVLPRSDDAEAVRVGDDALTYAALAGATGALAAELERAERIAV